MTCCLRPGPFRGAGTCFGAARKRWPPGGGLVIRDFILEPDRAGPPAAALFALNLPVGTRRGNAYAEADYRQWLQEAGFQEIRRPPGSEELLLARRS